MAAGPGGIGQLIMSALQSRSASGGGGMPGQGAMPGGGDPSGGDPASQYAQQVSELKGADPGMLLRQVTQIKKIIATLAMTNMERLPNVAGQLFKIAPAFDRVIKEIHQAQNVNQAVSPPIGMGAAQPPTSSSPGGM